jgi:hypothetical protein
MNENTKNIWTKQKTWGLEESMCPAQNSMQQAQHTIFGVFFGRGIIAENCVLGQALCKMLGA